MPPARPPSVLVVGGGVAGISAATALAEAGLRVDLLERRGVLGGRASSFVDQETGETLDACKHVTLACCTNLHTLFRRLGNDAHVHYLPFIDLLGPDGRVARIAASFLPPPLHTAPSLLRLPWLTLPDKLSLALALRRLPTRPPASPDPRYASFAAWAIEMGVTPGAMRGFLDPVISSACNAPPDEVSLSIAAAIMRNGFLATRTGSRLGLFDVALCDLYDAPCRTYLANQGGLVRTHAMVAAIDRSDNGMFTAHLRTGEEIEADVCVVAATQSQASRLLARTTLCAALRDITRTWVESPIIAAHFWFDRLFACPSALGLVGRQTHWLFAAPSKPSRSRLSTYLTTVTSADRDLASQPLETIRDVMLQDARAALSITETIGVVRWRVVRTHDATFVPSDAMERLRPSQRTSVPGLYLAGDWTRTGWPSTMEGAARSGHLAAQMILEDIGRPRTVLAPDGSVV